MRWRISLDHLQPLGRALMLPIAVLPAAGLMLRLGQPDMLDIAFIAASGNAIFANLGLIFAIGLAVGLARENHGASGLAGAICYLVMTEGAKTLLAVPPEIGAGIADEAGRVTVISAWSAQQIAKLSVPAGIVAGLLSGWLYNRYHNIKFPDYLAFFGGRRFVPIAAGAAGLAGAVLFGYGFPLLEAGIDALSRWVVSAGSFGLFLYGFLNRLLIVTGLHHILNNIAWFILGDFHGATGDLKRFFAGDPTAGGFMSGFFPVMMFGLPAACFAMYRSARPENRKVAGGVLLSVALTSFLTGVTEPVEFLFMFLAPALYAVHAVLMGLSMVIMDALGVRLGFGFSGGAFDYIMNFNASTRPLLLFPVGAAYALIYYAIFRFCIVKFNLMTLGREIEEVPTKATTEMVMGDRAQGFIAALGGAANLTTINACTTRLRLVLVDNSKIDEAALKLLGSRGILRSGNAGLQVVLGPIADQVAGEIRAGMLQPVSKMDTMDFVAALGGKDNIASWTERAGRLCLNIVNPDLVNSTALPGRGAGFASKNSLHILTGQDHILLANLLRG